MESLLAINAPFTEEEYSTDEDLIIDLPPPAKAAERRSPQTDPWQPIISNFRVIARTNLVLRSARAILERRD